MKRLFSTILTVLLCFSLFSCHGGDGGSTPNGNESNDDARKDPIVSSVSEAKNVYDFSQRSIELDDYILPYRMYLPDDYSEEYAYPLFIFLHGAGERGSDNSLQLKNVVQNLFNDTESPIYQSIFIAPQCPTGEQWVNTPFSSGVYDSNSIAQSDSVSALIALIEELQSTYSINADRIYLMGLSMGAYGVWDLLVRHTELFAAAVPICGGADPSKAQLLTDMPIQTFHGTKDTSVPPMGTDAMVEAIRSAGGTLIEYEAMEGKGHVIWDEAVATEDLIGWLFYQRKQ